MKYENPLINGIIIKRYKRFLSDIQLENGEVITAHTPNTGSMATCWEPGWPVLLSYHDNPKRKLKYGLEMIFNGETWIHVNTSLTNKIAIHAIQNGIIPELTKYSEIKSEYKIGKSRIDILLHDGKNNDPSLATKKCFVEVKNVTLQGSGQIALFPDAVSTRGQKHLEELISIVEKGDKAAMLFVINRGDVNSFSPAKSIDPKYADLLLRAFNKGVQILPYQTKISTQEVKISKKLTLNI